MKRRILSILLLAALVIGLLPQGTLSVNAYSDTDIAYPVKGGNLYFDKASGTITDCDNSVTSADIPAQIDGVTVTSIGESAFENCSSLTSVTVPESVTNIGNYGFYFCGNLQSVYFMGDAPELGNNVFDISNIWYDEPVIEIEDISIRGLVLYYLEVKEGWTTPTWNGYPTEIWERENEPDPAADEIAYPVEGGKLYFRKSTGEIFDCDQTVTKADIPEEIDGVAVTKIGVDGLGCSAFENCAALTEVTIPNSVTEIGDYAFSGCTALMSVTIPDSVTSIGKRAFYWCDSLTSVTLPSSVTSIDEYTFSRCGKLTNITIPNSVTSINYGAFSCCSSLTSVTIPESVTSIGYYAFSECTGLTSVTIPNSVTNIPASAFNGCSSLTDVTVPSSVTVIKISAFEDCTGLQSVYFMGDAPVLEENAFSIWDTEAQTYINNPDLTLYYIDGKANWAMPTWNGYPTATWDGVNVPEPADEIAYPVEGGNLYFRKSTGEIYDCDEAVTAADIPAEIDGVDVRRIGCSAFNHCSLTSVTIPSSVTSIGDWAFYDCPFLISVTLPDCAASVGNGAFRACGSLIRVTIENPLCDIYDSADTMNDGEMTVIYGCANSTAQAYAEKYGYTFCLISNEGSGSAEEEPTPDEPTSDFITGTHTNSIADGDEVIIALTSKNKAVSTEITVNERGYNQMVAADIAIYGENLITKAVNTVYTVKVDENGKYSFVIDNKYLTSSEIGGDLTLAEVASDYSLWELEEAEGGWFIKNVNAVNNGNAQYLEYYNTFTAYRMNTNYPDSYTFNFYKVNRNTVVAFPVEDGNLYFDRETGTIIGCDRSATIADIPAEIDGIAVADVGDYAFSGCSNLTSVTIPEGVTSIGISAFDGCSSLKSMTISESVSSIGGSVFKDCSSLTSVIIPEGVTSIGNYAFYGCSSLASVTIPESVNSVGRSAFSYCSSLMSVTIPVGVTVISDYAFDGCGNLTNVTVPNSVMSIGYSAFRNCSSLTSVTIPVGVTVINDYTFDGCDNLTNVTVPNSVMSIGYSAFRNCSSLQSLYFMGVAPALEAYAFSVWNAETKTYIKNPSLILYYIDGKEGWTTPFWKGYPTATWMPVHEHSYVAAVIAPTCTERGCTTHTCSICCDTYTDTYTDALGHDYGDWTQTKAPTCTEKGEGKRTCSRCDAFEVRELDVTDHTEVIDRAVPATCTEAGKTEGKHCAVCGTVLVAQETVAALGHDYGDWTQTKVPTCTEKGEEKRTCSRCDAFEVREIAAHGHTEVIDPAVPATCTEAGKTEGKHCAVCGTVIVAQKTVAALGHDYGDWTQTKAPTCTEKGEEKRTCSRCDAFEVREIAAHGHTEVIDPAVPATCTEAGKTEGKHCSVCGTVLVAQETVPALGHSYKDGVCTVCGAKDPDAQPAAPVEFSDVSEKAWYYEAVEYAVENGLMNGVGGGKFDPEGTMTRAMLVTVLWRYEGEPAEGENSFTDVPNGTWYTEAVAWAAANGIVGGVGNGKFDPNGIITREQMATILFRYAQKRGFDTSKRGDLSVFPDSGKVSSWAKDAMRWAVAEQIINGSDGYLLPQGNATRAQVAALLMRFINKIETAAKPVEPPVDPKHVVTAGTRKLYIGMSLEDLSEYAGAPEETLPTTAGYTWYVYGTKDYTDYVMAGVYENKVVAICASGADFSYRGCSANGSEAAAEADDTYSINVLKDKNDNSAVYGILLTDKKYRVQYAETKEALAGESRVAFHMANAFRVLHGVGILTWCDKAATAARLHSEDMATQNYVSHTSADGRLFYMRLRENGVLYNTCAENLCAGYYSGVGANNAWVNSALHRANLLNASMDRCGVGFAYELNSDYRYYAVSDYYQAR